MSAPESDELEMLRARNDRLAKSLKSLVKQLERVGGFSTDNDQAELRIARAVIAEER